MTNRRVKRILFALFLVYCAVLAYALLSPTLHHPNPDVRSYNLIPLATIVEMLGKVTESSAVVCKNIGMNILLFLPMGMALPVLFPKMRRLWRTVLVCLAATVLAEVLQFLFHLGTFDVDDILLNVLGGLFGYCIVQLPPLRKFQTD